MRLFHQTPAMKATNQDLNIKKAGSWTLFGRVAKIKVTGTVVGSCKTFRLSSPQRIITSAVNEAGGLNKIMKITFNSSLKNFLREGVYDATCIKTLTEDVANGAGLTNPQLNALFEIKTIGGTSAVVSKRYDQESTRRSTKS